MVALTDEQMDECMLAVFSALFVEFEGSEAVSPDDVRRALWPKGVPKVAEVVARHCCLALIGVADFKPEIFEQIGQVLFIQIAERQAQLEQLQERERE